MLYKKYLCLFTMLFLLFLVTSANADPVAGLFSIGSPTLLSDNSGDFYIDVNQNGKVDAGDIFVTITGITTIGSTTIGAGTINPTYTEVTAISAAKIKSGSPTATFSNAQLILMGIYEEEPLGPGDTAYFDWATGKILGGLYTFTTQPGLSNDGVQFGLVYEDPANDYTRDSSIQAGLTSSTNGAYRLTIGIVPANGDKIQVIAPVSIASLATLPPVTAVALSSISFDGTLLAQNWPGLNFTNNITGGNGGFSSPSTVSQWPAFDNLDFTLTAAPPCIELVKEVSPDNITWYDANDPQCSDAPGTLDPAYYRLTIRNCGGEELTSLKINDAVLGITNQPVSGNLPIGGEIVLTSATSGFGNLSNPNLCPLSPNNPNVVNGGLRNVARVDAVGVSSQTAVFDEDPACIRCICIDLIKEVSSNGIDWLDANSPDCSDAPTTSDPAYYRLTIRNCGGEELTSLKINDAVLGITNQPVSGNLPIGGEIVLTSATSGFGNLSNPNLCPLSPNNPNVVNGGLRNVARVDAVGVSSQTAVFDEDPACIRCIEAQGACRMTGGHVEFCGDTTCTVPGDAHMYKVSPVMVKQKGKLVPQQQVTWYTVGGQIGAPTAACLSAPDTAYGNWEHVHHAGTVSWNGTSFNGGFAFHSGTASAPDAAYIKCIKCADPGWCVQARCAPFKQIFWEGTGVFHNIDAGTTFPNGCKPNTFDGPHDTKWTIHYYRAHVGDFGEPAGNTVQQKPADQCGWTSSGVSILNGVFTVPPTVLPWPLDLDKSGSGLSVFGEKGGQNCSSYPGCTKCGECPDWYEIEIHCTADPTSPIIYKVGNFITHGNHQIHPEVGDHCSF